MGRMAVLQVVLDKCVEQSKRVIPGPESHFKYHLLTAADLHKLQTLSEYNPTKQVFVVMP